MVDRQIIYLNITPTEKYKFNAANFYNKMCRIFHLQSVYITIKIGSNNKRCQNTLTGAVIFRINQEIRFFL